MYGCVEEDLIQSVVPCMPRGSRIMISCHPPQFLGCLFISKAKKIIEKQVYIYKKVRKG